MGLKELVRYLALVKLCNNVVALKTLEMYFVIGRSPGEIAKILGVSKDTVRGYIERAVKNAGGPAKAPALVRAVMPHIAAVKPVIEPSNSMYRCVLCGESFMSIRNAMLHVRDSHRDALEQAFEAIMRSVANNGGFPRGNHL